MLPSGQDVLSLPQQTRCNPSLANEACPVSARHPGASFPVHHPQEAVPKLTNGALSPSLPWSAPFHGPYKQGSGWWHYISMCTRAPIYNDVLLDLSWYAWLLWGSTGWFYFQVFLLKLLDFILIVDLTISIYNLSSYASVIVTLSWILNILIVADTCNLIGLMFWYCIYY